MQYRQDIVTRLPIRRMELITNSIVTIRSTYLAQLGGRFFCVLEIFCRKSANLVVPPTDGSAKCIVRCKAHSDLVTEVENSVQIDA